MTETADDTQALLRQSAKQIRRMRAQLGDLERRATEPIAIVGMSCRMPGGADDADSFWAFLRDGGDGIMDVPETRWDVQRFYDPAGTATGKAYTRRGGFLDDVGSFDAGFFGVSPREAASIDPQQRLVLEVAWEALENAGQAPDQLVGSATGVFVGVTTYDYNQLQMQQVAPADLDAYSVTGNASPFAAGRLSYWLGLRGPSLTLDTACSSSLVGVHLAAQSLRNGESDIALAGGVNVLLSPEWFVVLSKARMLAPDGRCKTFDAAADGYVRGEGCGIVVLKRLSDAAAAGDRVLAVIRGSAVNQDGRSSGITVPNAAAQQDVVRAALRAGRVDAAEVSYVEAHGTGTPLGDPIELRALSTALGAASRGEPVVVGSVKTNIGHLEPAAGVAGLIKVVLSLQNEEVPPHLHLSEVNPEIALDELGFTIPTERTPWPSGTQPRVAGISSFGASGTNAHVVVAEAPALAAPVNSGPDRTVAVLTLSAKSPAALTALAQRYRDHLGGCADPIEDVCFTANTGRARFAHRAAASGASRDELCERLRVLAAGEPASAGVRTGHVPSGAKEKVVFLFTGQGSQYPGMAEILDRTEPTFRAAIDRCDEVLAAEVGRPLRSIIFPADADRALIDETRYTQPALFAVEYALAELWRSWGVEPAAVLGHSIGELVAACVAGVMPLEDGLVLAARRGGLMHELCPGGAMAAVFASVETVQAELGQFAGKVSVAAVNGPESIMLSGAGEALAELLAALTAKGIRSRPVTVTRAFHSPLMEAMLDPFELEASKVEFAAPRIPLVSNVDGKFRDEAYTPAYLREHVRAPVDFLAGMTTLFDAGYRTFLEIGPAPMLTGMAARFAPDDETTSVFLPTVRPRQDDGRVLADTAGALYVRGVDVDWSGREQGRGRRKAALPSYPFQRARHWFEPSQRNALEPSVPAPGGPLLGRRVVSPLETAQFEAVLDPEVHVCLGDCVMDGMPVVNVGCYLEAAFAAGRELLGDGPVGVDDCLVPQSLVLEQGTTCNVSMLVEPDGTFRYYAEHPASDPAPWVLHAQGRIGSVSDEVADLDLAALTGKLPGQEPGVDFYRRMWRRKLYLGPSAQWIDQLWFTAGEALARMRAPLPEETEPYLLHPGLTDAMLQMVFSALPEGSPADAAFMMVGIDRFALLRPGAGGRYCHAVLRPESNPASLIIADLTLTDADGRAVARADGVYLKRAAKSAVLRTADSGQPRAVAAVSPTAPTATHSARSAHPAGLPGFRAEIEAAAPDERAALTRKLLVDTVARALGADGASLDVHEPLANLGLDSLMALEVKESLSKSLSINLPLVAFLDGRGIAELGGVVLDLVGVDVAAEIPAGLATNAEVAPDAQLPTLLPDPASRYEPFGLTDLQQAYLIGRSGAFELGNVSTYFFIEVDLVGVDLGRLEAALRTVIDRHDMLRAIVQPDGYQQVLSEVPEYRIGILDLRGRSMGEVADGLAAVHAQMKDQVFDTTAWPLFDIRATLLDGARSRLHIGMDALICDAWSTSLVFAQWAAAYREEPLPPTPDVTYRDYVLALRGMEGSELHRRSMEYWMSRVPTLPPAPELPVLDDPAALARPEFTHRSIRLDQDAWARFKRRASEIGVTPSAAVCAAYAQVLAAWSKSAQFTLNVLFFNRLPLHEQLPDVVGNFSATTLLEVDSSPSEKFADRAERVQRQLWADLEHSHVSGVRVLRELNRARGNASRAGMPVVFASTVNFAAKDDDGAAATGLAQHLVSLGESGREVSSSIRTPQVWLDHQVVEDDGELIVNWDVVEAVFPVGLIDAMWSAYREVLHELCDDEQAWHRPAPVLVPTDQLAVRAAANATAGPRPSGLLHDAFGEQARLSGERPAVIAPDGTLSYAKLDAMSNQVDRWLRERGAGRGRLVGIVMHKGWAQIVAALGILKSGAAYVPIDASVPSDRLRLLLASAGVTEVLTQAIVDEATDWPDGVARLRVDTGDLAVYEVEPLPTPV